MNTYTRLHPIASVRPLQLQTGGSLPAPGPVHGHNGAGGLEVKKARPTSSSASTEGGDTSSAGMQVAAGFSTLLYFPH